MKRYFVWLLLIIVSSFFCSQELKAATLYGKVIEINDGDAITVLSMKRPVRVQLLGVDAPEQAQPFGDVAKRHLSDLIYDRSVVVEYSGIGTNGNINGRVLLDGADIGAQMIRDGAAWVDPNSENRLKELDRQIYGQSEQAARNEKRGLWQSANPVAPWEFVKSEVARTKPQPVSTSLSPLVPTKKESAPELTTEGLMWARIPATAGNTPRSKSDTDLFWSETGSEKTWKTFRPAGESFSAFLPSDGEHSLVSIPLPEGSLDVNYYVAKDRQGVYEVAWFVGPPTSASDTDLIQGFMGGLLDGVGKGYKAGGGAEFSCEPKSGTSISSRGYTGREFDLTACTIPGFARVYTKQTGDKMHLYAAVVFFKQPDEGNASRFLKSFTVGTAATKSSDATKR